MDCSFRLFWFSLLRRPGSTINRVKNTCCCVTAGDTTKSVMVRFHLDVLLAVTWHEKGVRKAQSTTKTVLIRGLKANIAENRCTRGPIKVRQQWQQTIWPVSPYWQSSPNNDVQLPPSAWCFKNTCTWTISDDISLELFLIMCEVRLKTILQLCLDISVLFNSGLALSGVCFLEWGC